jgi:S-(hydroxymethyl)glutathione dehydrogenase/alcohol dehydrogenase
MDYAVISENRLVPISSAISLREAALFGCAIPTGAGIVCNEAKVHAKSSVAVFGVGGIGASAVLAADSECVGQLIAIDLEESKLAFAKELGATHTIDAKSEDVLQSILKITEGKGVDFAIEAVGQKNVMQMAFKSVKDRGGLCVLAGNVSKGVCIECDPFDFIKGKKIIGSWGGGVQPDRDIPRFLERFLKTGRKLDSFISHVLPLRSINEAIDLMDKQKAARILIDCGS